eukprot:sb/3463948/
MRLTRAGRTCKKFHYGNKPTNLHVHLFNQSFNSKLLLATCTAGAAVLAIYWAYRRQDKDEPQDQTEIELPKDITEETTLEEETVEVKEELTMNEEVDMTEGEDEVDVEGYEGEDEVELSESDVEDVDMEEYEEGEIVRGMSRGQSILSLSTSSTLCNSRDIMMGSMDLIIEEEEEDSDEYEEGEILVISDSEESEEEGDVSEEESEREIHIEENLNEARNTEEEPRTLYTRTGDVLTLLYICKHSLAIYSIFSCTPAGYRAEVPARYSRIAIAHMSCSFGYTRLKGWGRSLRISCTDPVLPHIECVNLLSGISPLRPTLWVGSHYFKLHLGITGQCKIYGVIASKTQGLFLSGITIMAKCMVPVTPQPFNLVYPNEHDMWAIAILLYLAGTSALYPAGVQLNIELAQYVRVWLLINSRCSNPLYESIKAENQYPSTISGPLVTRGKHIVQHQNSITLHDKSPCCFHNVAGTSALYPAGVQLNIELAQYVCVCSGGAALYNSPGAPMTQQP